MNRNNEYKTSHSVVLILLSTVPESLAIFVNFASDNPLKRGLIKSSTNCADILFIPDDNVLEIRKQEHYMSINYCTIIFF